MQSKNTTEQESLYDSLDEMSTGELLTSINNEDKKVAEAVAKAIPKIEELVERALTSFNDGGRVFYIGAGTSGRLGVLDASEIPPTYGIRDRFIGLIAGGDKAIRTSVEDAEDNVMQAGKDLAAFGFNANDILIGIAASGTTPYVIGGASYARSLGALTACITNNEGSPLASEVEIPIEVVVGPEFVTGSTRMKSGTSQKLVLNMISTGLMIRVGRVKGNKMVNMQLSNEKLVNRGVRFLMEELKIEDTEAHALLKKYGSVNNALKAYSKSSL